MDQAKNCRCEIQWRKEKAVMQQQIELLEMQILEHKQREDNYKKFNDSILNMYNQLQLNKQNVCLISISKHYNQSKVYKEIQESLEQYSNELIQQKQRNSEAICNLENENRTLKNEIQTLQMKLQDVISKYEQEIQILEDKLEIGSKSTKQKGFISEEAYNRQIQELQQVIQYHKQEANENERQYKSKIQEKEQELKEEYDKKLEYYQEFYKQQQQNRSQQKEEEECNNKKSENSSFNTKSSFIEMQHEERKRNFSSIEKSEESYNPNQLLIPTRAQQGCIVSIKKFERSKTNLNQKVRQPLGEVKDFENTNSQNNQELCVSQFVNVNASQINCRNSNVMEINPQQLLKSSEFIQLFGPQNDTIQTLLNKLKKEQNKIEQEIQELENQSPSQNMITERQKLQQQLRQITKELKKAKEDLKKTDPNDHMQISIIKSEVQNMINKLVKAKGKLAESFVSTQSNNNSILLREQQKQMENKSSFVNQSFTSQEKSLSQFSRQLKYAKSIDGFQQLQKCKQNN